MNNDASHVRTTVIMAIFFLSALDFILYGLYQTLKDQKRATKDEKPLDIVPFNEEYQKLYTSLLRHVEHTTRHADD